MSADFLNNQFLVAMPSLDDAHFAQSVTLLCEHNSGGALGLVINRPSDLSLSDMLDHIGIAVDGDGVGNRPVFWGGPVTPERGFVLHQAADDSDDWDASLRIGEGLAITSSRDILEAIGRGEGPGRYLVTLGYASWGEGQLEDELLDNAWLNAPSDKHILFELDPVSRWEAAVKLLGVDVTFLSGAAGHA